MTETVKVQGLKELRQALTRDLPVAVQGKVLQSSLAKAAQPITRQAKQLVPVKTGRLRRAIFSGRSKSSTRTREERLVGVRSGKRYGAKDAFYWRWIEFGRGAITGKRVLGNSKKGFFGREVKPVPARPFLRPAFESRKREAVERFKAAMLPQIEKAAAKIGRKRSV